MTCLVYGIVFSESGGRGSGPSLPSLPPGVGGGPVTLIEAGGLSAAVSRLGPADLTPNLARALSYAKVVEALHADRAVLPMRYGCVFEDEREVAELLGVHGEDYAARLRGLDGCVEMGVRVLLSTPSSPPASPCGARTEGASGRAYLASRAARYAREDQAARTLGAAVERARGALGGLAERVEVDRRAGADGGLGSLYFLVKRTAVEVFRRAFGQLARTEPARLLLSGPWPPYNFAAPEREENAHG